jgi:hypothetical protein
MDEPRTKTVTRYGISVYDKIGRCTLYLTGFRPAGITYAGTTTVLPCEGGEDVPLFTRLPKDACTWGSPQRAETIAAYVERAVMHDAYEHVRVYFAVEPTYNV